MTSGQDDLGALVYMWQGAFKEKTLPGGSYLSIMWVGMEVDAVIIMAGDCMDGQIDSGRG